MNEQFVSDLRYAQIMFSHYRLAEVAALLGDPARAAMVTSLWDGRSRPAGELSRIAGVTPATASAHLAQLVSGGILRVEVRGRHRFHRLADERVAQALEALFAVLEPRSAPAVSKLEAVHRARLCYDHLAGRLGVVVSDACIQRRWLTHERDAYALTPAGRRGFTGMGIELDLHERARRPMLRSCLDWTERREHLGGGLGAAIANALLERDWIRRQRDTRVLLVTNAGRKGLSSELGVHWE